MNSCNVQQAQHLRAELELLRARYDSGAVSECIFQVIKALESELAWFEHHKTRAS